MHPHFLISDAIDQETCRDFVCSFGSELTAVSREAKKINPECPSLPFGPTRFSGDNIPFGPRLGMMQSLVGNFPSVWNIRLHPAVRTVFESVHGTKDLFTSIDGVSFHPRSKRPAAKDWAHVDDTRDEPLQHVIYQGQVILNDCQHTFRCSPGSHHCYDVWNQKLGKSSQPNFRKFKDENLKFVRETVESDSDRMWQVPVPAPAGSIILWDSRVIHSSVNNVQNLDDTSDEPYANWRAVVYVCFIPKRYASASTYARLQKALCENRMTNHSARKLFGTSFHYMRDVRQYL